jgi:hypothetical protein
MESLVSLALLFMIVVVTVGLVIGMSNPILQNTQKSVNIKNAERNLMLLDEYIRTVAREGKDSARIFRFDSPKLFEASAGEDSAQFYEDKTNFIEYLTRSATGNLVYIAGNDVDCLEKDGNGDGFADLVMENGRLKAVFRRVNGSIDTSNLLLEVTQKSNQQKIYVANFSAVIDDDLSTSAGVGYSEISHEGTGQPECQAHAFVNSTVSYDIYYKLYAGADFIAVDVRNIR